MSRFLSLCYAPFKIALFRILMFCQTIRLSSLYPQYRSIDKEFQVRSSLLNNLQKCVRAAYDSSVHFSTLSLTPASSLLSLLKPEFPASNWITWLLFFSRTRNSYIAISFERAKTALLDWQLIQYLTFVIPSMNARVASSPGPSTVLPSSSGPQEAL